MLENGAALPADLTLPIWWAGRQWAVTGYGIERIDGHRYEIQASRLGKTRKHPEGPFCDWHVHLACKGVDIEDFIAAYRLAAKKWPNFVRTISPKVLARSEEEARNIASCSPDVRFVT